MNFEIRHRKSTDVILLHVDVPTTRGLDLSNAFLRGAGMRGLDCSGAILREANLRDADLREANLRDVDLAGADLRHADLRQADVRGADLSHAATEGALWTGCRYCDATRWPAGFDPELNGAVLDDCGEDEWPAAISA